MTKLSHRPSLVSPAITLGCFFLSLASPARGEAVSESSTTGDDSRGFRILFEELQRQLDGAGRYTAALGALDHQGHTPAGLWHQYNDEAEALSVLRGQAIEALEAFVERYPDDPDLTPDALLRLAELHYRRSSTIYIEAAERWAALEERRSAGENVNVPPEPVRDHSRTFELTRRIIRQFPRFRHIDAALYLLGLSLYETAHDEEARAAWLHLVCSNHFQYRGPTTTNATPPPQPASPQPFVNPYTQCMPVVSGSPFVTESWFRIGETHFDYDYTEHGLDLAIASFQNAANDRTSILRGIALYKLAWSYYRADSIPEAVEHFAEVVAVADASPGGPDDTNVMVRPEAIQYLAICFAEDDWDGDTRPDPTRGVDRLQDPLLLPQDAAFTPEVYFQTGNTYFDLARYSDAVEVYELALRRWPLASEAPRVVERIALAHERNRDFIEASAARDRLVSFHQGSAWNRAHAEEDPDIVRDANQLARNALYDQAVRHHTMAHTLRREGESLRRQALLRNAHEEYEQAAQQYRTYLERYPHDPDIHEITYNLAEVRYFSGDYREAAEAYARVRDSVVDERFREPAAFRAIRSLEQLRDEEVSSGRLSLRRNAPAPTGTPPRVEPISLPELVAELNAARDAYVRLPDARLPRSASYRFETAMTLYRYGHWSEARARFTSIYGEHCNDHEVGREAQQMLVAIATALGETEEVDRLEALQADRQCAPPTQAIGTGRPSDAP